MNRLPPFEDYRHTYTVIWRSTDPKPVPSLAIHRSTDPKLVPSLAIHRSTDPKLVPSLAIHRSTDPKPILAIQSGTKMNSYDGNYAQGQQPWHSQR